MRLSAIFLRLIVFAAAAAVAFVSAQSLVREVEVRSVLGVQETLVDQGYSWASVLGDGLQVILEGDAPTEAVRFRAISAASGVVDASRVIDNLNVVESADIAPPEFAVEILRNDADISLIGLIPASTDREALRNRITRVADGGDVTDLLEVGDYPAPVRWRAAMAYALRALETLEKAKISVHADRVVVDAIAESAQEKRALERALDRNLPDGVEISVDIRAPRPVISPFTVRFIVDDQGPRFDACAVDTDAALARITEAATDAGFTGQAPCVFALGAPSRSWGEAVALSIEALREVGGGTVTVSDTDVTLVAIEGTAQRTFDNAVGQLENALPDAFALDARLPVLVEETEEVETPFFTATRSPEGMVQLRGRVQDDLANTVLENYAFAKFGQSNITMGTRTTGDLPQGWEIRVLAGVEALSALSNGVVEVEPGSFSVRGNTGNPDASAEVARLLIDKLGQSADFDINVTYVEQLDPVANLPTPEECIARITRVTEANKILFDPGSAQLTAATQPVVDAIAEILRECGDLPIRVAGYTDSQGREEMNQQLSQDRADAVLTALRARRVPVSTFESVGFGEANPIADNETEEGREANRRIEFSLIPDEPDVVFEEAYTAPDAAAEDTDTTPAEDSAPAGEEDSQ